MKNLKRFLSRVRLPVLRMLAKRPRIELEENLSLKFYGDPGRHIFFGYYDLCPFSHDEKYLLSLSATTADNPAKILLWDLENQSQNQISETSAWCWQQGCRLRWWSDDCIIYNSRLKNTYAAEIFNIANGKAEIRFDLPLYDITPDKHYGFSLNFLRLQRLRPGYGYQGEDHTKADAAPCQDGIFRLDLLSGERSLLLSLEQAANLHPRSSMENAVHYFNHISCSPDSRHLMVFHIWTDGKRRWSRALVINLQNEQVEILTEGEHVSHYTWWDESTVLLTATEPGQPFGYHVFNLGKGWQKKLVDLQHDGHPSRHPKEKNLMITDTYPDRLRDQGLILCDTGKNNCKKIASFYSPSSYEGEMRCDLHPRFSPSGRLIAIDTACNGFRRIGVIAFPASADSLQQV